MPKNQISTDNDDDNKGHVKFKPTTHQGTPYLLRSIAPDSSHECRFICLSCKNKNFKPFDGYCENLRVHLKGKNHGKTIIKTDDRFEELEFEAFQNFLEGKAFIIR